MVHRWCSAAFVACCATKHLKTGEYEIGGDENGPNLHNCSNFYICFIFLKMCPCRRGLAWTQIQQGLFAQTSRLVVVQVWKTTTTTTTVLYLSETLSVQSIPSSILMVWWWMCLSWIRRPLPRSLVCTTRRRIWLPSQTNHPLRKPPLLPDWGLVDSATLITFRRGARRLKTHSHARCTLAGAELRIEIKFLELR